ncbi:TetR/AcrR family transcriptional regulator [Alkalisalibacterium limincola]|uniref:TetR/AcrR family transcriptional regulator n=1 Tax=Alkalisalibacterium limincola TaxID=2699169 RepID=A0A5C8KU04_9GAMM|nr:TetR/AcrR family transcriptional regulator [Alkalisalibacterium limincola]TXK64291.1 TetR/AcrR family transcriptional regulator [Alkalisalibacterium limincola]
MRYSPEHKQKTRERIIDRAARNFCRDGIDQVSIAGLMSDAGLTHGGFYAHFKSKEDVLLAALEHALEQTYATRLSEAASTSEDPMERVGAVLDSYLSLTHRDHAERGCAIAAVGVEAARTDPRCRQVFSDAIEKRAALLHEAMGKGPERRSEALALVSMMVGAMVLSRASGDSPLSAEILAAARKHGARIPDCPDDSKD